MIKAIPLLILLNLISFRIMASDTAIISKFIVREPKIKIEKPPVLLLLHGHGSSEEDLFTFANKIPDQYLVISLRGTKSLDINGFAWYTIDLVDGKLIHHAKEAEDCRLDLINFIEQLKVKRKINEDAIYLCGFSQGAIMSYSVGLTRPDLVKGIAILSGKLLEDTKLKINKNDHLQKLKIFISHGINDKVIYPNEAREAYLFLKSKGLIPIFKEYDASHEINNNMIQDLIQWLQ